MKVRFAVLGAAALGFAVAVCGCATTKGAAQDGDALAGRTYRQEFDLDGTPLVYQLEFGQGQTYTLTTIADGTVAEKTTFAYSVDSAKGTLTARLVAQWMPENPSDIYVQDSAQTVPHDKAAMLSFYEGLTDFISSYYAAVGSPVTQDDIAQLNSIYRSVVDYNFDSPMTYAYSYDEQNLSLAMQFTGLGSNRMEFSTPGSTSNPDVSAIFLITGYSLQLDYKGTAYSASILSGSAPVINTTRRTLTADLSTTDVAGNTTECGTLVARYTTEGTGNDTVLTLTVTSAPEPLAGLVGTQAQLYFIPDGFSMRRAR